MPSSREIEFSRLATSDIADILQYTYLTWGEEQWDEYGSALNAGFDGIVEYPEIGKPTNRLANGRTYRIREHRVYYQIRDDVIFIARVLHQKMDPRREMFD